MRPKSEIYTPKREDEHPHTFHMRSPPPRGGGGGSIRHFYLDSCTHARYSVSAEKCYLPPKRFLPEGQDPPVKASQFSWPEKRAEISRRHNWFPREMTSEQRLQKFHTDDASLSRSGKCIFSVGCLWHSHGKNPVRLYPKLQSQPLGLPKIFIDYLFFQADQSDCTKSVSIFNRFASSEER